MGAPTTFPFARMAAAFAAYERNVRDAARWAHPSWLAAALGVAAEALEPLRTALASAGRAQIDALSRSLACVAGVQPPSLDALRSPNLAVLDALPPEWGLRVLRMRALMMRRADVRRLIDKRSRQQLSEWIGIPIDRLTEGAHDTTSVPEIARLTVRSPVPALDTLDAQALACEGCALLMRDAPAGAAPFSLLCLALPRDMRSPPWLHESAREFDVLGTVRLFAQLPELIPEWAWLFG
ncbi:type III secretion protein HrpB4 [Paraburkholderia nemoris]|uniref:type III secretion protein HrpB4 n=1 Tax=Paraburkholderia nemoris TaxID=2793076 RepID=UPI0038B872CC